MVSKVLFARDVLDKNREIKELTTLLARRKPVEIVFTSREEWDDIRLSMFYDIRQAVNSCVSYDRSEHEDMLDHDGLTNDQEDIIAEAVTESLRGVTFTDLPEISWRIVNGVRSAFDGIVNADVFESFHAMLTPEQMSDFVCGTIESHLERLFEDERDLIDVRFRCSKCEKLDSHVSYTTRLCFNCEYTVPANRDEGN